MNHNAATCVSNVAPPPPENIITTTEEKNQGPLFSKSTPITIYSPTYDTVKTSSTIVFKYDQCVHENGIGTNLTVLTQVLAITNDKILVSNGSITNWNYTGVALLYINVNNLTSQMVTQMSDFNTVINGIEQTTPLFLLPGRYFWATWGFSEGGELLCSSPQIPFFIR